jgi:pimeloyl-ACP methyl ester carboxylesterase
MFGVGRLRQLTLVCCTLSAAIVWAAAPPSIDAAFEKFWNARSPQDAAKAAEAVVRSGVTFDEALARLKRGRTYPAQVKRGLVKLMRRAAAGDFFYDVGVPATYDPARKYQVRVQLHGGVMRRETSEPRAAGARGGGATLEGAEQIYVMPVAWRDAPWWGRPQLENIDAILDTLKRTYNVDENRVVLAGVSDGATGLYYVAMRDTTPFASFLPLNGYMMVLANDRLGLDSELFPTNLLNKPLFVVNGGQDPLYPIRSVEPYVEHLRASGVSVEYHPRPEAGHNTAWWPELKDTFEAFVRNHPRDPLPSTLTWETTDRDTPARAHWLVIDRVKPSTPADRQPWADLNVFSGPGPNHGRELFVRARPSGRVDLTRRGNAVQMTVRGVAGLTLLISPDAFDFSQPITVSANGRVVADARLEPSAATLLQWAARDNDRTMLFGAELPIVLK